MDTATMMLIGTGAQAGARISGGMSARDASRFNAAALERQATEEFAAGTRTAGERRRETELVLSKQRAIAAASGAGAGPSLLDIIGDTAARGEYQAQAEMYTAGTRARNLKDKAAVARYEGENAFAGSILEGVGGLAIGMGRYDLNYGQPTGTRRVPPFRTTVSYG